VTEPDDQLDHWLRAEVEPLLPEPGAFDRIHHRARHRKLVRGMTVAAAAVVVIAGAVTLPQVLPNLLHGGSHHPSPVIASQTSPSVTPSPSRTHRPTPTHRASSPPATAPAGTSSLAPGGSGQPVPDNFQPTSVTFVGTAEGAVIGQAGTPGQCATQYCTSLAGTSDYGGRWYGVSAPLAGAPDGASGVSQLRFLNTSDGWAFGPALWVTHDGGGHWTRESTHGRRVLALETAGSRAFALLGLCAGQGADYGTSCQDITLYSSAASSSTWAPVPGAARDLTGADVSAGLVLGGGSGYLLAPSGRIYTGPLTGAAWHQAAGSGAPCAPGRPGPGGTPGTDPRAGAQGRSGLISASPDRLYEACNQLSPAAAPDRIVLWDSADGGGHWSRAAELPSSGVATSLTTPGGVIVVATRKGLDTSGDNGRTWTRSLTGPPAAGQRGGFSYVGMTDTSRGVAVPLNSGLHELYVTTDGGATWHPSVISAP
jgi:hypothetical protein